MCVYARARVCVHVRTFTEITSASLGLTDKLPRTMPTILLAYIRFALPGTDFFSSHLRPRVELEHNAQDPVLLGGRLGHDPLRNLELHRHHRPPHALVVVAEGEENLRPPAKPPPPQSRHPVQKNEENAGRRFTVGGNRGKTTNETGKERKGWEESSPFRLPRNLFRASKERAGQGSQRGMTLVQRQSAEEVELLVPRACPLCGDAHTLGRRICVEIYCSLS